MNKECGAIGIVLGVCLTLPVFGAAPPAAADNTRGFYFGGGVGATWLSVYDDDYNNNDCCYYYGNYDYETSDSTPSFTLFGGYRFARYVAAEVGYFYSDNPEWDENFVYLDELNDVFNSSVQLDYQSVQLSVLGILPFARIWEVYVTRRIGGPHASVRLPAQ